MNTESYFPTGIVTGQSFCNREDERELLKKRLMQNAHVVLISPRRYGKSSLISQFTLEQKVPFVSADLLPATSNNYVRNAVVDGVSNLLDMIMPRVKKQKEKLLQSFSVMNPIIEVSAFGQKIKLTPPEKSPEETIMKVLLNLDKAAGELNKKLIFVIDEFQQIANLENSHALEASIRHAVERSKNVFYVFSGSNRTLLEKMFKDKDRPLYHLCDEIRLHRINKESYVNFIQKASVANWKKEISSEKIHLILELSECHPYYVNRLCRTLWDQKNIPSINDINSTWQEYVEGQRVDWINEIISRLTVNQRTLLAALAKEPELELQANSFAQKVRLSTSSIKRTANTLIKKDYIFKNKQGYYHVLNPVIRECLARDQYFDL